MISSSDSDLWARVTEARAIGDHAGAEAAMAEIDKRRARWDRISARTERAAKLVCLAGAALLAAPWALGVFFLLRWLGALL